MLRLAPLTLANFADFETLTACGDDGRICYCSFWHMKMDSVAQYDALKKEDALALREIVHTKVRSGFQVGVLAYDDDQLAAWISVALLPETYWCWKRVASLGQEAAATTAGITCFTIAPSARGKGLQRPLAEALRDYGRAQRWTAIEAYPFDDAAVAIAPGLAWPGYERPFVEAGYSRVAPHWLSKAGAERWINRVELR